MDGARFERRARLVRKAEFQTVFDRAEKSADRYFTVLACSNSLEHARLGLAISKRNAKLAVLRNSIKRIIRESFRHQLATLGGVDFVVMARPGLSGVEHRLLFESLNRHWARLAKRCVRC
ncbi:ribonuclease P protein component [Plasticicumulans acidivorans]|uniref:ribonuclease P protein component n=1 Tax=Plasticicumulans acidivorans TaxID=886464 RepID=UPI001FE745AF|nr:ribonuclease P protein component [Plasticicumulans acidivorans]